ncbi:signal recognition particle receptor subunit alpha, partial [Solidesulfovibrio sp.]|uniref:signal recognition particle receptor subunit alpha n=1 Tax=Solidesulfovibrio sp. TaxID=2910990 RepID=UPI002B21E6F1
MGFFSKLKKFWKAEDALVETAAAPAGEPGAPAQAVAEKPSPASETQETPAAAAPAVAENLPEPPTVAVPVPTREDLAATRQPEPEPAPAPQAAQEPTAPAAAAPEALSAPDAVADGQAPWRNALIHELRQAEPRLSAWLDILLADVAVAGPDLWDRLRFLFTSLEAPAGEADAFVAKFADWIAVMEYDEVELFRSELQYRLALALDLEDEEDERNRLFLKLSEGLAKTKEQIVKRIDGLLGHHKVIDEAFWEELEEILIMADVGFEPAAKLMDGLRERVRKRGVSDPSIFKEILREELAEIFKTGKTIKAINPPEVVMMIGVNGVGKT